MSIVDTALELLDTGMAVFPLWGNPPDKRKEPILPHGCLEASRSRSQVEWWFKKRYPDANCGVVCGALPADRDGVLNSLFVLDIDMQEPQGMYWYNEHRAFLDDTYTVRTGNRGLHLYYLAPHDTKNTVGSNGGICPHIDTRGNKGGYVLSENSTHPNGNRYERVDGNPRQLADVPEWLLKQVLTATRPRFRQVEQPPLSPGQQGAPAHLILAKYVGEARHGARNTCGYRLARQLLANYHDGAYGWSIMQQYARAVERLGDPPYTEDEARKSWDSAQHAPIMQPWSHWIGQQRTA